MAASSVEPMNFIETGDVENVNIDSLINSLKLLTNDCQYDKLSQLDTSWNVVKMDCDNDVKYDADDEMEVDMVDIKRA